MSNGSSIQNLQARGMARALMEDWNQVELFLNMHYCKSLGGFMILKFAEQTVKDILDIQVCARMNASTQRINTHCDCTPVNYQFWDPGTPDPRFE
jgi:hypothetical protein